MGLELKLSPGADTVFLGGATGEGSTAQLTASASAASLPIQLPGHVFETTDSSIAAITTSSNGVATITARGVGTTTVSVRVNDTRARTTIVVLPIVKTVTLAAPAAQYLVGDSTVLTAKIIGWSGETVPGQTITFSSSSPAATVSAQGRVHFASAGSTTITAKNGDASATVGLTALRREFIGGASGTISSGLDATCGLLPLGRTFCFGRSPVTGIAKDTTCFGDRTSDLRAACTLVPLQIAAQLQLSSVAVGDSVACGIAVGGKLYCWGDQKYGQIGNGVARPGSAALPTLVTGPLTAAAIFTQVTAGGAHACGLLSSGAAFCWGKDSTLQLGGGDALAVNSSTPIPVMSGRLFKAIAAGRSHTCGIASTGETFCWGKNDRGQLGRGDMSIAMSESPQAVAGGPFVQLSARGDNTCGLARDGTIHCWGANESGQTGTASPSAVAAPSRVPGTGYTFVSVGGNDSTDTGSIPRTNRRFSHACALQGTTVVCWGANNYGQLGRGTTGSDAADPAPVAGGQAFTALSTGTRTSCAVAADGAYCWGSSVYGATGNQVQALKISVPERTAPPQ
jgi:alpha-tubulin suppressor-like RCC1 family protein